MKIAASPTFTRNVTVLTPTDVGFEKENLKVTFNYLDIDAVERFDLKTSEGTTSFLVAVVNKLDDLTDDDNKLVNYTEAVRDALLKRQYVRQALAATYFDAVSRVKVGN